MTLNSPKSIVSTEGLGEMIRNPCMSWIKPALQLQGVYISTCGFDHTTKVFVAILSCTPWMHGSMDASGGGVQQTRMFRSQKPTKAKTQLDASPFCQTGADGSYGRCPLPPIGGQTVEGAVGAVLFRRPDARAGHVSFHDPCPLTHTHTHTHKLPLMSR